MKSQTTTSWSETTPSGDDLVRTLSRCIDACRASELSCALALDVVETFGDEAFGAHDVHVLRACGSVCARTAASIAALHSPDLAAVAAALLECRVACRAARSECQRRSFDACCRQCADACDACAALCEQLLAGTSLAAA